MNLLQNISQNNVYLIIGCVSGAAIIIAIVGIILCVRGIRKHKMLEAEEADKTPADGQLKEEQPVPEQPSAPVKEAKPAEVEEVQSVEEQSAEDEPDVEEDTADEDEPDEPDSDADEVRQEKRAVVPETPPEGKIFIRVRYNRSYTAKLIQSGDALKGYYNEIKNELMRYGVTNRISWRHETFRSGRKLLARLAIRGKTLCVYLALNPADYEGTKYKLTDVSHIAKNAAVPSLYRIKNDRRCKYAKQLIADLTAADGLQAAEVPDKDYSAQYPYEELEPLIDRKLVKLLPYKEFVPDSEVGVIAVSKDHIPEELLVGNVSVTEADDMFIGENVEALVEVGARVSDRTKKEIINIDTLGKYFKSGETANLEEIKKRIPTINKRATYLKVLARGTLDKALTVEADDYSPAAIKMIVITGGKAVRLKNAENR